MDVGLLAKGAFECDSNRFRQKIYMKIDNSRDVIYSGYKSILGDDLKWIPEYDKISDWMSDNNGKGVFLYGNYGRGKTLFLKDIFPRIMESCGKVCNYYTMTDMDESTLKEALGKKIICLDDVGVESKIMSFGNERMAFPELMDRAEQNGNLVIVSSNMGARELVNKYGQRTLERIISCCVRIPFEGNSFRK